MPFIEVSGSKLYYECHGEGPPLLMVSGLRGLASHWRHQLPMFSKFFQVIVHDQRGTGQSEHSLINYSVDGMANDVLAIMDALRIEKAHYVGHSTGAAIGQCLAVDHADRLRTLSLVSGWPKADRYFRLTFELRTQVLRSIGPDAFERFSTLFVNPPWFINSEENRPKHSAIQSPLEVTLSRIQAILAFDRSSEIQKIRLPTHVVCSDDDRLTPLYFSEELARQIPNAVLSILQGGGHSCNQVTPDAFNQVALAFLQKHADDAIHS